MVQAVPQIVAAELGLRPEDVIVRQADTDAAGYDVGVGGGRTTVALGAASRAAAIEVRGKLLAVAARDVADAGGKADVARRPHRNRRRQGLGRDRSPKSRGARRSLQGPLAGVGRLHQRARRVAAGLRARPFHRRAGDPDLRRA